MSQDLTRITPGDKLAIENRTRWAAHMPSLTYSVFLVERVTATQIVCKHGKEELRFRRKDGCLVGDVWRTAFPATHEILETSRKEESELQRWRFAVNSLNGLLDKSLSQLNLSTAQLEKLAEAWAEIQKMKKP